MIHRTVQVKQREFGKIAFYDLGDLSTHTGAYVIVEADRGLDFGRVLSEEKLLLDEKKLKNQLRKIIRVADKADIEKIKQNTEKIEEVMKTCNNII